MIILLFWILFGITIGWIAAIVESGSAERTLLKNMALGVVGSIIGGVAGRALEENSYTLGNSSMLLAIMGGVLAIFVANSVKKRTTD
jgi:uncharacterized membrane protein YeaQ/YmgE (transglycosylase-associated protein family)